MQHPALKCASRMQLSWREDSAGGIVQPTYKNKEKHMDKVSLVANIIDRLAGTKKATVASGAGITAATATFMNNPGNLLFPNNPEYATAANAMAYLISFLLMMYREKRGDS